jgi:hypothetical protein
LALGLGVDDDDEYVQNENVMPGIEPASALITEMDVRNMLSPQKMFWNNPLTKKEEIAFFGIPLGVLEVYHGGRYFSVGRYVRHVSHISPYHHTYHFD